MGRDGKVITYQDFCQFVVDTKNGEQKELPFCIVRRPVGRKRFELVWCETREELVRQSKRGTFRRPVVITWSRGAAAMGLENTGMPAAPTSKPRSYGYGELIRRLY